MTVLRRGLPRSGVGSLEYPDRGLPSRRPRDRDPGLRAPGDPEHRSGSQFTGTAFVGVVQQHGIQLSMDGKGAWRDNLFVERLWKCVKYEEVYLHAYDTVAEAQRHLAAYFTFYNQGRPHSALDGRTPDMVYFAPLPQLEAA
jgi:transposase InsO family protein